MLLYSSCVIGITDLIRMIEVNEANCKGCHICINFCPKKVLAPSKEINNKGVHPPVPENPGECVSCRMCEVMCPDSAIFIIEDDD